MPGGRAARPLPFPRAARPTPRFSVVFIGMSEAPSRAPQAQNISGDGRRFLWFVGEIRAQPSLGLSDRDSLPRRVVLRLVATDPADGEIARLRMSEVDPADAGGRRGGERLRQLDPELLGAEQPEERLLLAVVGTGGIAVGRPDAAVALGDQLVIREAWALLVPLAPCLLMEVLGERLCQTVRERLDHDRPVVVVLALVPARELVGAVDRDGESADVVAGGGGEIP